MKVALLHSKIYLRIAIGMLFILLIGFKTVSPMFVAALSYDKEMVPGTDTDESDKKSESSSSLEKEFTRPLSQANYNVLWHSNINHCTVYNGNYKSSYYQKITIPPPDGVMLCC